MDGNLALSQRTRLLPPQLLVPVNSPFLASHFLFLLTLLLPQPSQVTSVLSVSTAQRALARSLFPTDERPRGAGHCSSALLCTLAVPGPYGGQCPAIASQECAGADQPPVCLSGTWSGTQ